MATATDNFMDKLLRQRANGPLAPTRADNIAAAMQSGEFEKKRQQYNADAIAMNSPTQMDAAGNIVERAPNPADIMQMTAQMSGGNTISSRPEVAQRLLAMQMQGAGRLQAGKDAVANEIANQVAMQDINSPVQRPAAGVGTISSPYGSGVAVTGKSPEELAKYNASIGRPDYASILEKMRQDQAVAQMSDAQLQSMAQTGKGAIPALPTNPIAAAFNNAIAASKSTPAAVAVAPSSGSQTPSLDAAIAERKATEIDSPYKDTPGEASMSASANMLKKGIFDPSVGVKTLQTIPGVIPRAAANVGATVEAAKDIYYNELANPLKEFLFGDKQAASKRLEAYLKEKGIAKKTKVSEKDLAKALRDISSSNSIVGF